MARFSRTKFSKYRVLRKRADLIPHLPETRSLKPGSLLTMLNKYGDVIVKPTGSGGGNDVVRVTSAGNGTYRLHLEHTVRTCGSKEKLISCMGRRMRRHYIVQQRIPLATVNGRPFDLRVMIQRRGGSGWQITGRLAKIAGKGYIVTNLRRSKGKIVPVEQAIRSSASLKRLGTSGLIAKIDDVARRSAGQIKRFYPRQRTIGLDIGLDRRGGIWIIEANFEPAVSLFLHLKNRSMYRNILAFNRK